MPLSAVIGCEVAGVIKDVTKNETDIKTGNLVVNVTPSPLTGAYS